MDEVETYFLQIQGFKPQVLLRYSEIDFTYEPLAKRIVSTL